jgi:hypothetical protein
MNAVTKACEPCPKGQEPSAKGDKCETPETEEEKANRGRCPLGKILDPSIPGQVSQSQYFCSPSTLTRSPDL